MTQSKPPLKQRNYRLAYVVTHPIQYQSPLLRLLNAAPEVDLEVLFLSDFSLKTHIDAEFGVHVEWGVPLTQGFTSHFVKSTFKQTGVAFFNPWVSLSDLLRKLHAKKWDAIWVNGYANMGLLTALLYARFSHTPMLIRNDSNPFIKRPTWKNRLINRWLVRHAHGLLYCGTANRQHYLDYGARDDQLFSVPFAVDNHFFRTTPRHTTEIQRFKTTQNVVFLFASKMTERKNAKLLLQAFLQIPAHEQAQAHLVFVGDGPDRVSMEAVVAEHKLQTNVHFLGFKNQAQLPSYYFDCDVFVLPSEKEPFAVVVNEAMNAAKPLILAHDVGAHYDLLQPGVNGWLVPTGDVHALSQALSSAIAQRQTLPQMGQASLKIIENWDFKADVRGIVAALTKIERRAQSA